ncbi:M28 family metallopeptidase [Alkaliphilus peptidifermentans]|nr:M28 family metallopeptidase [Alkaliphilus peptidifermentans]
MIKYIYISINIYYMGQGGIIIKLFKGKPYTLNYKTAILSLVIALAVIFSGCSSDGIEKNNWSTVDLQDYLDAFDGEAAYQHVAELASDGFLGRNPGTEGNELAAEYIKDQFEAFGLLPGGDDDSYYQHFDIQTILYNSPVVLELINEDGAVEESFTYRKDYIKIHNIISYNQLGRATFRDVSYEIEAPFLIQRKDEAASAGEETVLIIDQQHINALGSITSQKLREASNKSEFPLVLYVHQPFSGYGGGIVSEFMSIIRSPINSISKPMILITPEVLQTLESYENDHYMLRVSSSVNYPNVSAANVIGRLPAAEETDDTLIISAHFDHFGVDADGQVNYGALDNASGVGAMLEIARVISNMENLPPFNIEFIAFNGEEHGLLGAYHYVSKMEHNPNNLKMINLDMVGANNSELMLLYTNANDQLYRDLTKVALQQNTRIRTSSDNGRSDHSVFGNAGADAVMFIHLSQQVFDEIYHRPYDTIDQINKEKLEEVARVILQYIYDSANEQKISEAGVKHLLLSFFLISLNP